jgi:hypothetical protein
LNLIRGFEIASSKLNGIEDFGADIENGKY